MPLAVLKIPDYDQDRIGILFHFLGFWVLFMCGIVGIASCREISAREWLVEGCNLLAHRGPDGSGKYWSSDGRVGFGHRRLAIIDLSQDASQPMLSDDGHIAITYNGEVYNFQEIRAELTNLGYKFRSTSDTEVILQGYRHWGTEVIRRLQGMFAFAIYDQQKNWLFCARDRAGEKPFFYHFAEGTFRFASELKALLADRTLPRRVDPTSLDYYLAFGYVPGERCMLQGFSKLPPAHALTFNLSTGKLSVQSYWELPDYCPAPEFLHDDTENLSRELERILESAVKRQLVADVPVGLLLSGGVDSSLITALASRSVSRLKTFTVGFSNHPDFDETSHASLIAQAFGTDHTVLHADTASPELLPVLARQYDEPVADSSMIPTYLVTQQISRECKVALGGDGGDELFGGYNSASQIAKYQQLLSRWSLSVRRPIAGLARQVIPQRNPWHWSLTVLGMDTFRELIPLVPKLNPRDRKYLLGSIKPWKTPAEAIRAAKTPNEVDAVQRMTRFDFLNYMPEDIMVKVDRASMLNSLEVRAPFLDVPLIEFAFRQIPSSQKATPANRKIILKQLTRRLLPKGFDNVRKIGFRIPLRNLICAGSWRSFFESVLLDRQSLFSQKAVQSLFKQHCQGADYADSLFAICMFELWRREYQVAV